MPLIFPTVNEPAFVDEISPVILTGIASLPELPNQIWVFASCGKLFAPIVERPKVTRPIESVINEVYDVPAVIVPIVFSVATPVLLIVKSLLSDSATHLLELLL